MCRECAGSVGRSAHRSVSHRKGVPGSSSKIFLTYLFLEIYPDSDFETDSKIKTI